MRRSAAGLVILFILIMPLSAHGNILNLRGGVGTAAEKNRDTGDSTRYVTLFMASSYQTTNMNFALELPLKWELNTGKLDRDEWNRKGDWLRPLKKLKYGSGKDRFRGGLEVIDNWTPGGGYLVRDLSGRGEIDYILPGFKVGWSGRNLELEAGVDRVIDPAVQAVGIHWRPGGRFTLILEGALDPEAPVAFSGNSSGGRPVADSTKRLSAQAAGVRFKLVEGDILDLMVGAHTGDINGDAKGRGGELSASLDLSRNYLNRLQLNISAVNCEGGYVPAWFDGAYSLYRWGPRTEPFLAVNPLDRSVPDRKMLSFNVRYDLGDFFIVKGGLDRFSDNSLRRGWFRGQLKEQNGRGIEVSVWSRAESPGAKLFTEDADLHSRVSALYNLLPHFLMRLSFEHSWVFSEEDAGFTPTNSIHLGVMYDISL